MTYEKITNALAQKKLTCTQGNILLRQLATKATHFQDWLTEKPLNKHTDKEETLKKIKR